MSLAASLLHEPLKVAVMQMLCKVSSVFSDVQCPVCGQGFLVYWTRQHAGERDAQRPTLQHALRAQHTHIDTTEAHAPAFQLPDVPVALPQRRPQPAPLPAHAIPVYS